MFNPLSRLIPTSDPATPPTSEDVRSPLPVRRPRSWQRKMFRHRRLILAALGFIITLTTLSLIHPISPPAQLVVVTTHDVAAGTVLSANDVALVPVAREALPHDAISTTTAITHHALLTPMFAGEVVRQRDVLDSRLVHQIGANSVAVPVRVSTSAAALVQRGDHVDVLAGNPGGSAGDSAFSSVGAVATDVVILIPSVTTSSSSMLGTSTGSAGSDVVVIAKPSQAAAIAAASVQSTLVLALRGSDS